MSEVLSQSEIDAILSSFTAGNAEFEAEEEGGRRIKEYDFKSPKKFSKEQTKIILGIYENLARHLSSYFSGILRAFCEISINSIEELPYYEYNNALPDSILIGRYDFKSLEGDVLVDISHNITFTLVERLLGGNGEGDPLDREYTEIEISLMQRIFRQIAIASTDAWGSLLDMKCILKEIESNARLIQSMATDEAVLVIVMDVTIDQIKGTINFCLPCVNLENIIDHLSQNKYAAKKSNDKNYEEALKDAMVTHVNAAPLMMKAVFGETVLSLNDIVNLQVGDVIKFDQAVGSEIKVNISEKTWFLGIPGVKRNKKVIKISKVI